MTESRSTSLLLLGLHEFSQPISPLLGYIRMLRSERAGPLSDQQRHMLAEAEKASAKLAGLLSEMRVLATLEAGEAPFNRSTVELGVLVTETAAALPPSEREVAVTVTSTAAGATVQGDATRLRTAFAALLSALRREVVGTSPELLVRLRRSRDNGQSVLWLAIADADHIDAVDHSAGADLGQFDEWRGGSGFSLAIASHIVCAHDGQLWSPADDPKAGAIVVLPEG